MFKGSQGIILVYDISNRDTFINVKKWSNHIKDSADKDVCVLLVGNKSDLALEDRSLRKVAKDSAIEFVKKHNLYHWTECSAKNNINIKDTFKSFYKSKLIIKK